MSISCLRCITKEIKGNNCTVAKCNLRLDIIKREENGTAARGERRGRRGERRGREQTERGTNGRDKMVERMRRKEVTSTKQTARRSTGRPVDISRVVALACVAAAAFPVLFEFDYRHRGKSTMKINVNYEPFRRSPLPAAAALFSPAAV